MHATVLTAEAIKLMEQGRYVEAVQRTRQALALRERALGPNHVDVAESLYGD